MNASPSATAEPWSRRRLHYVSRRVTDLRVQIFADLYECLEPGQHMHDDGVPKGWRADWRTASPDRR